MQPFENVDYSKVSTLKCCSPKLGSFRCNSSFLFTITRAVLEQHKEPGGKTFEILMLLVASSHCIAPGFLQVQCPPVDHRQCNPCQTLQHLQSSKCSVSDWGTEEEQECCPGDCAIKANWITISHLYKFSLRRFPAVKQIDLL